MIKAWTEQYRNIAASIHINPLDPAPMMSAEPVTIKYSKGEDNGD